MATINTRIADLEKRANNMEADIKAIRNDLDGMTISLASIEEVAKDVKKIWQTVKWVVASTLPTLVAAGYVNGVFGQILSGLFGIDGVQ